MREGKDLRHIELRLLSELMRNSKRSDRELAQILGVSQPTVTRTRNKLEKEGYVREYTVIPDFLRVGYEIMAVTFVKTVGRPNEEGFEKIRNVAKELESKIAFNCVMAVSGQGLGYEGVIISFHRDYDSYLELKKQIVDFPFADRKDIETFMMSLRSDFAYRPLTFSTLAKHLMTLKKAKEDKRF